MFYKAFPPVAPNPNEWALLYMAPPDKGCIVSSLWVCPLGDQDGNFSLSVVPAGDTRADRHLRYKEELLRASRSHAVTTGITLDEGSAIYVLSNVQASFALDGCELDQESPE